MFIWTIWDALQVAGLALLIVAFLFFAINRWIEQAFCKHNGGVGETGACDAICRKCGKNLGFIGTWREKNRIDSAAKTE